MRIDSSVYALSELMSEAISRVTYAFGASRASTEKMREIMFDYATLAGFHAAALDGHPMSERGEIQIRKMIDKYAGVFPWENLQ